MIKTIWESYKRYLEISSKASKLSIAYGVFGAFLETFSIYFLAKIITDLGTEGAINKVEIINIFLVSKENLIILFLIFSVSSASLYFLSNKNIVKAKCKVERFIRQEITDLTLKIKWEYYLQMSQGDISKSIIAEGQNISEGYMYFLSAITYSLIAFTYFLACLILVPNTLFILLIYSLLTFRIFQYFSLKADHFGKNLSKITSNIGKWTTSIFNNLKYLRAISKDSFAKEESEIIFKKFANSYENAMVASYKSKYITELLTISFIVLSIIFIIFSGATASTLILSLSLFIRMTPKVYNAQSRLLDSLAMVSWPKLHHKKIIWAKNFRDSTHPNKKLFEFDGTILFKSVEFQYPNSYKIFKNINLSINKQECIGIRGKSGVGKSTLLDLITGIIKPTEGSILISGENINTINIKSWRKNIGIVMQESFFKNDTLAANIALGKKIDIKKIKLSLIKANAWNFVNKLPNGIDELILDRGSRFSGGERQRLSLARALYLEPKILLLDEPTTGLDIISEKELISSIKKLKGTITIIIISHKKEILSICDKNFEFSKNGLKAI